MLRSLPARLRGREPWLVVAAFLVLFAVYAQLVQPVVQNGDSALYNEQVAQHQFALRVIHIGYLLLGSVFYAVLPLSLDRAMNAMALSFGIAGAYALYVTAKHWGSRWAGVSSVLLLLGSTAYVRGMVMSEVDILSASLVMISYALFARRRSALSGAAFGAAMLCTPISATMLPLFLCSFASDDRGASGIAATARAHALRVLWFGLLALAVYVPIVAWHLQAYFYGPRGLTTAPHQAFNAWSQFRRGAAFFHENLWAVLPLCLAGVLAVALDKPQTGRDQLALGLVLSVLLTGLLADRTEDVPAHLPSIAPLCLLVALFLDRLAQAWNGVWLVPGAAFLLMGPTAFLSARAEVEQRREQRAMYREMRAQSQPLEFMLVDLQQSFTAQRIFEHYAYGRSYTGLAPSLAQLRRQRAALLTGKDEYVLYFAGRFPDDLKAALAERYVEQRRAANGKHFRTLVPRSQAH